MGYKGEQNDKESCKKSLKSVQLVISKWMHTKGEY